MSTLSIEDNRALVRDFIEQFWNERDEDSTALYVSADYTDHAYQPANADGMKHMLRMLTAGFPDHRHTIEELAAEGDTVFARITIRGTHLGDFRGTPASGRRIEAAMYRCYRLREGRISEHWGLFDLASLLRQIGGALDEQTACKLK